MTVAVDEATNYAWVKTHAANTSANAAAALREILSELSFLGWRASAVRVDNGREFCGDFEQLCKATRIGIERSANYAHHENGRAERMARTLLERCRAMIEHAKMDIGRLWNEVVRHACHLCNITWKEDLGKSSYHALHPEADDPTAEGLRVFGAHVNINGASIPKQFKLPSKISVKGIDAFYVGRSRFADHSGRYFAPSIGRG